MPKYGNRNMCVFTAKLSERYPFFEKTTSDSDIVCKLCYGTLSIAYGGNADITRHLKTLKHLAAANLNAASVSQPTTSDFQLTSATGAPSGMVEC